MERREFCTNTLAGGLVLLAGGYGLLAPRAVLSADGRLAAFQADSEAGVVEALFGGREPETSDAIVIEAPLISNGDAVPVSVIANLEGVNMVAITVERNERPLCALVMPHGIATGPYATRLTMTGTSHVTAYVQAQGRVYKARQLVKVSIGGFGGVR